MGSDLSELKASFVWLERMWVWGSKGGFGKWRQEDWGRGKSDKRCDSGDMADRIN